MHLHACRVFLRMSGAFILAASGTLFGWICLRTTLAAHLCGKSVNTYMQRNASWLGGSGGHKLGCSDRVTAHISWMESYCVS